MTLKEINNKYSKDMYEIAEYMESVKLLFFSLCNTNDDLNVDLPALYCSIEQVNLEENYSSILAEIKMLQTKIKTEIDEICVEGFGECDISPNDPTADGDLLLFLDVEISKGNTDQEKLFVSCQAVLEALCITKGPLIHGDRYFELFENRKAVYHLIKTALNSAKYKKKIKLSKELKTINQIEKSLELFNLHTLMNIYRQCFIQTMSYFDNCIFELMKSCMQSDYFYWLGKFKPTSIKTNDMATYSSFEEFRDSHIDDLLKGCYMKDLLAIINGVDTTIFEEGGQNVYKEINEFICRRNAHIHNNGITDKAYLAGFNIYNCQKDEFLTIDENLVHRTQVLTQMIVKNISNRFNKTNL